MNRRTLLAVIGKKAALVLLGLFLGFLGIEAALRLYRGAPPPLDNSANFRWAYADIYQKFFKKDRREGVFRNHRPRSIESRFTVRKRPDQKRVFIIGESIAIHFDVKILKRKFKEALPQYEWEIINCGMGGYDSYRILLLAEEIATYEPDIVILMMGNNDGCHDPVKVNRWVYLYPFLSWFWSTRIVTDYLDPVQKIAYSDQNAFFEKNLATIIDIFNRKRIPLVTVTFANNLASPIDEPYPWNNKNFFSGWWLLSKKPEKALDVFKTWDDPRALWFLGRIFESLGQQDLSVDYYRKNIRTERIARNDIIRECASRYPYSIVVDMEKIINGLLDGGVPDYRVFWDRVHMWPPVYSLVADEVIASLRHFTRAHDGIIPDQAWHYDGPGESTSVSVAQEIQEIIEEKYAHVSFLKFILMHPDAAKKYTMLFTEILKFWHQENPGLVERCIESFPWASDKESIFLTCVGEVFREKKDLQRALEALNRAIAIDPSQSQPYLFRGLCYYDMGKRLLADDDFSEFKRKESGFEWLAAEHFDALLSAPRLSTLKIRLGTQ